MTNWDWFWLISGNSVGILIGLSIRYWQDYYDGRHSVVQELADRTFPVATVGLSYPEGKVVR